MSESEKASHRAQGELQNFLLHMRQKFALENRSQDYQEIFWHKLDLAMLEHTARDRPI